MKKLLLLAAVVTGMVGCSNEDLIIEEVGSTPITLTGVTKKASRGGLDGTKLTEGTDIHCTGLLHGTAEPTKSSNYFTDVTFTSSDGTTWTNSSTIWPIDGVLDFWAYTCASYTYTKNTSNNSSTTVTTNPNSKPTPVFTKADATGNFATMTLNFGNDLNGHNDIMVSKVQKVDCANKTSTTTALTFKHAMAWLVVNVTSAAASDLMKIYSVQVNGVKVSGSLMATNNGSDVDLAWTPYREDGEAVDATSNVLFPAYGESLYGVLLGDAVTYSLSGVMVLPQAQTSITMEYAYKGDNNYKTKLTHTIDLTNVNIKVQNADDTSLNGTHLTNWDMGQKYVYTIKISADNKIMISASVEPFATITYEDTI